MMTPTLTISRLTKRFGDVEALKAVSLTLEAGRRAALLGHNGAGKSTLMKIVLGLVPHDGGEVSVCGAAPGSPAARTQVAYLPENVAFHPALTGEEQLRHYLALRAKARSRPWRFLAVSGWRRRRGADRHLFQGYAPACRPRARR
ncbi:ATP-binding cassette domain-containing protein [Shinella sp. S4-D37]|uniref:ATP-binding cassette domain-containing protein n=1 Tax=Shinella sp. S4-D37 TaxID=3161999 RepID=UPI003466FF91